MSSHEGVTQSNHRWQGEGAMTAGVDGRPGIISSVPQVSSTLLENQHHSPDNPAHGIGHKSLVLWGQISSCNTMVATCARPLFHVLGSARNKFLLVLTCLPLVEDPSSMGLGGCGYQVFSCWL
jgi:hypothetical protein